jgi:hypothetical protein
VLEIRTGMKWRRSARSKSLTTSFLDTGEHSDMHIATKKSSASTVSGP